MICLEIYFILIILLILIVFSFLINNLKIKLNKEKDKNSLESNEKNIIVEENQKLKEEIKYMISKIEEVYESIKNVEGINLDLFREIKEYDERINLIYTYKEFIKRFEEERERKSRNNIFKFVVMQFSLDFYEELSRVYQEKISDINKKIKANLKSSLRRIDFVGESRNKESVYILLPMTDLNGASIVAARIQTSLDMIDLEQTLTSTVIMTEVSIELDIKELMIEMESARQEALKNGGNIVKAIKI